MSDILSNLRTQLESLGQGHIFSQLEGEIFNETHPVVLQLNKLNVAESLMHLHAAEKSPFKTLQEADIKPLQDVLDWSCLTHEERLCIKELGMTAIVQGQVAAVIMSGGQGTRLGFDGPKGMYKIGIPSRRCIFRMHIEKLLAIRRLAGQNSQQLPSIPVYIMTSEINTSIIQEYFRANDYFGYPAADVFFFEQALEPCLDFNGKLILESTTSLALAPDGNGGVYNAMRRSGALDDMCKRGVKHLHIYGIDNVLTKSADPVFIGGCIRENADIGNKVVWRSSKEEKVGVGVEYNNKMLILEYSEIPKALADATDAAGKLVYGAGNICQHYIRLQFLLDVVMPTLSGIYHLAKKKIPFLDVATKQSVTPAVNNGYKLEMYVFDIFPLANRFVSLNVSREEEFAPVKNEPGNLVDSPDTARQLLSDQAIHWLRAAGAVVHLNNEGNSLCPGSEGTLVEISPMLSYEGEGLELFRGQVVRAPCYLKPLR